MVRFALPVLVVDRCWMFWATTIALFFAVSVARFSEAG